MARSVLQLVNQALGELGLPATDTVVSEPDDALGFQTLALLNALGDQLTRAHDWQFLMETVQIDGDGVNTLFALPLNYGRMVNQTQWASANKRPMYGPMSPQGWSWVQYGIVSVGVYYRYRILANQFEVFPVPPASESFHFYYISKNWVYDPDTATYKSQITKNTDQVVFDEGLMIAGMKVKLWSAKGMNAQVLAEEFQYMLDATKAQSQGAGVIALDSRLDYLYISGQNIPDGSWQV